MLLLGACFVVPCLQLRASPGEKPSCVPEKTFAQVGSLLESKTIPARRSFCELLKTAHSCHRFSDSMLVGSTAGRMIPQRSQVRSSLFKPTSRTG